MSNHDDSKWKFTLQWWKNSFLQPSHPCARPCARQKSIKLNFTWKKSIFYNIHVTYIWSLKWLLSAYNDQFMNENIHSVKYFHIGIKKFVRALWCARNFDDINIFSLKRFLYDFLWSALYTIFPEEVFIRFDGFNGGRISGKVWSVSRVEMIYIHNMNDSQECFDMNRPMYINMWKPNTLAIQLYFFVIIVEKLL